MSNPFLQYPGTNKAAVVIAKYYEGAFINGSVYFQGKPISSNVTVVVRKNLSYIPGNAIYNTPIDYDKHIIIAGVNNTYNFSLIAGEGAYISVIRNPELRFYSMGILPFNMQRIMFNGETGTNYAPISDDDAMRMTDSNFERTINITIYPANVSGYVYDNLDGKSGYNTSTGDKPLNGDLVLLYEIEKFNESQIANGMLVPEQINNNPKFGYTNESGYYSLSGLLPGYYLLNVYEGDYSLYQEIIPFAAGNNTFNISRPINSSVSGTVYYDNDDNSAYNPDTDEKISDAKVELIYYSNLRQNYVSSKNTTTDSNGYYSLTDIIPGDYYIQAVKGSEYVATNQLTIDANTTQTFNISMSLAPVNVSGYAKYLTIPIENATISFEKDNSISNNTAVNDEAVTNKKGYYSIDLQPGTYNVTVTKGDTVLEYYLEGEKLTITKGQGTATMDFALIKKSVTVTGRTLYDSSSFGNITILFMEDESIENNTAISNSVISDINGDYSIEIAPGSYIVSISIIEVNESGTLYDYKAPEGLTLKISDIDIAVGKKLNIELIKELKETG